MKKFLLSIIVSQVITFNIQFGYAQNQMIHLSNLNEYSSYSDIWGFRDDDGKEYAILGTINDGFSFINITDPVNPVQVAFVSSGSGAKDVKIYTDPTTGNKYAYLVTAVIGGQLQIADLSGLPGSISVTTFSPSNDFGDAHNVYIDVLSKRLYLAKLGVDKITCVITGGMMMLDISNPVNPIERDLYQNKAVHDLYVKNNLLFAGVSDCAINSTLEGVVEIFDISSGTSMNFLTSHTYTLGRAHSMWTTEDGNFMVTTVEEEDASAKFWNIQDIFNIPSTLEDEFRKGSAIVHNAFIKGNFCYISHYSAGLVVLDISDINNVIEVGYFDTYPTNDNALGVGAWGVFPYLPSCNIIVSDMQTGLYVLTFPQDLVLLNETIASGDEQGFVAKNTITATNFTVESGARSTLVAKDEVVLEGESVIEGEFIMRNEDPCAQSNFQSQRIGHVNTSNHKEENPAFMNEVNKIINGDYLSANYPNPFVQSTTIAYSLKESGPAALSVYNVFGRKVAELVKSGNHAKGIHYVKFEAADLPEGVYFYILRAGDYFETKKMLIIK